MPAERKVRAEECGNCRFWVERTDNTAHMGGGYCRRYPPFFSSGLRVYDMRHSGMYHAYEIEVSGQFLNDAWPNVHKQSWCGEFHPLKDSHGAGSE